MHRNSLTIILITGLFTVLCTGPLVRDVHGQDADSKETQAAFDSLFAAQITAVRATGTRADDLELAKQLLAAAETTVEHKQLLSLICEAAYTLGISHRDGYESALAALSLIAQYIPEQREQAVGRTIQLRRRLYSSAKSTDERKLIAARLLDDYLGAADTAEAAQDYQVAVNYLRTAVQLATSGKSPRAAGIASRYRGLLARKQLAQDSVKFIEALNEDPKNTVAAGKLVLLYVELADDPAQAIGYTPLLGDELLKKLVALAAQDNPADIADADLIKLADWYRGLAESANARNVPAMYSRSFNYYSMYLSRNAGKNSLMITKAKLMVGKIRGAAKRQGFVLAALKTKTASASNSAGAGAGSASSSAPGAIIAADFKPIRVPIAKGGSQKMTDALGKAISQGNLNEARKAIAAGAGVNMEYNKTLLLFWAIRARASRVELVRLLLSKGADPNTVDRANRSALWRACSQIDLDVSRLLRQYGAKVDQPFYLAVIAKDVQWVSALLAAGADADKPSVSIDKRYQFSNFYAALIGAKRSPAIAARSAQMVKLLLDSGADPNKPLMRYLAQKRTMPYSTLSYASFTATRAVYDMLLAAGAKSSSPLHDAISVGDMKRIDQLSADPKLINQRSPFNDTPLSRAINARPMNLKVITLLIERGANVNQPKGAAGPAYGRIPLHNTIRRAAISQDGLKVFELLIKAGADPNPSNGSKTTTLHIAAQSGHSAHLERIIEILIAKGGNINAKDSRGRTPLQYARHPEMVTFLKKLGAKGGKGAK